MFPPALRARSRSRCLCPVRRCATSSPDRSTRPPFAHALWRSGSQPGPRRNRDPQDAGRDRDTPVRIASIWMCSAGAVSRPFDFEIEWLDDVEHLDQRDTAGAHRRHRHDLEILVAAAKRRPLFRGVRREVCLGDQATVGFHVRFDRVGDPALVERVRTLRRDSTECLGRDPSAPGVCRPTTRRRQVCRMRRPTRETSPSARTDLTIQAARKHSPRC